MPRGAFSPHTQENIIDTVCIAHFFALRFHTLMIVRENEIWHVLPL